MAERLCILLEQYPLTVIFENLVGAGPRPEPVMVVAPKEFIMAAPQLLDPDFGKVSPRLIAKFRHRLALSCGNFSESR